jgi:hypothetical protein
MESKQVSKFFSVGGILVDTEFQVLGELLVEFLVVLLVFSNFCEHFKALFDNIFLNNFKNSVLLKSFSRNVERKIV